MPVKISEKKLLTAIVLFTLGICLVINNSVNFSSQLISEKMLLLEVIGIGLVLTATAAVYRTFKKA